MKRLMLALVRFVIFAMIRTVELIHSILSLAWHRLDRDFDLETATIREIEKRFNISRRKAYRIYRSSRTKKGVPIYHAGEPVPSSETRHVAFTTRKIGNTA